MQQVYKGQEPGYILGKCSLMSEHRPHYNLFLERSDMNQVIEF